jgi:hypothetical protein
MSNFAAWILGLAAVMAACAVAGASGDWVWGYIALSFLAKLLK